MAPPVEFALLRASPVPSHSKQRCVGGAAVETIGIEVLARPLEERGDFFVAWLSGQAIQELLVARGSTGVFWRTGSCARLDERGTVELVDLLRLFDANDVDPAIAEVVLVLEVQPRLECLSTLSRRIVRSSMTG